MEKLTDNYLFSLIFERGIYFLLGLVKIFIILSRLLPDAYVEYVSVLGLTTFVATVSRLGVEIYMKKYLTEWTNTDSFSSVIDNVWHLTRIPLLSMAVFSIITGIVEFQFDLYPSVSPLQIMAIIFLISVGGLVYEYQISVKEDNILIITQIISSGMFIVLYVLLLPFNATLKTFIPILLLANLVSIFIYLFTNYIATEQRTAGNGQVSDINQVSIQIGTSFFFLASTLGIRLLPISFIDTIENEIITSIALTITMIDIIFIFFNQGTNYLIISNAKEIRYIPDYIGRGYFVVSLLGLLGAIVLNNLNIISEILADINPDYGKYLVIAVLLLGYPKIQLMLSSAIAEGYAIRKDRLQVLSRIRIVIFLLIAGLLTIGLLNSIPTPELMIIYIIIAAEFLLSTSSTFVIRDQFRSVKQLVMFTIPQFFPIVFVLLTF